MSLFPLENALRTAILKQNLRVFKILLSIPNGEESNPDSDGLSIDIHARDEVGNTFLHYAAHTNCLEIVETLLTKTNIKIDTKNSKGRTPLHHAVAQKKYEIAKTLKQQGADLFTQDKDGNTLLHTAVENDDLQLCEWLLLNGIDPEISTMTQGITALDIALDKKSIAIIELLSLFGCLSGKLLQSDLLTLDLNLAYHFVIGAFYKIPNINGEITELVTEKDKNCGGAITSLAQFQSAKKLLDNIKSQSFTDNEERHAAYKILLSVLTLNWKFWLDLYESNPTPLLSLYEQLKNLKETCENYAEIFQLTETIEKNTKAITIYSMPLSKLITKLEQANRIYYCPSIPVFLSVLQLNQPSHLQNFLIKKIQQMHSHPDWRNVKQNLGVLTEGLIDLIGDLTDKTISFDFNTDTSGVNFAIYYLDQLAKSINAFERDLRSTWVASPKRIATTWFLISLLIFTLGIVSLILNVAYAKSTALLIVGIVLSVTFGGAGFISLMYSGIDLLAFSSVANRWQRTTLFRPEIFNFLTRFFQKQNVSQMLKDQKKSLQEIVVIVEDILLNMKSQNPQRENIFELLQLLRNPHLRIKDIIRTLHNLQEEILEVVSDLKNSDATSDESTSNNVISLYEYHRSVSFFPLKVDGLVSRADHHRTLNNGFEEPVIIVDLDEDFENRPNDTQEEKEPLVLRIR